MLDMTEIQGNGKFEVFGGSAGWLVTEYDAVVRQPSRPRYEVRGRHYEAVKARIDAINSASRPAASASRAATQTGTCVLCGDPTDRLYYRYCSECYR